MDKILAICEDFKKKWRNIIMRINKVVKCFSACTLALCMLLGTTSTANAASSDNWKINYTPGAPSSVSNQVDDLYVAYSSDGFVADCKTLSGTQGRMLNITAKNAGGLENKGVVRDHKLPITTTGPTKRFDTNNSIKTDVYFQVTAKYGCSCKSTGIIKRR